MANMSDKPSQEALKAARKAIEAARDSVVEQGAGAIIPLVEYVALALDRFRAEGVEAVMRRLCDCGCIYTDYECVKCVRVRGGKQP